MQNPGFQLWMGSPRRTDEERMSWFLSNSGLIAHAWSGRSLLGQFLIASLE